MWYFITEVLIAIILLVGMLFLTYAKDIRIEEEILLIKSRVWNGLEVLDDFGILRKHAIANETQEIKNFLVKLLPGINLEVTICYELCVVTLPYEKVISVSYFLAGDYGNFKPTLVIVSSWLE